MKRANAVLTNDETEASGFNTHRLPFSVYQLSRFLKEDNHVAQFHT